MIRGQKWGKMVVLLLCAWLMGTSLAMAQEDYFTLVDEAGTVILETGTEVHQGDLYIDAQNHRYIVERIAEKTAYCRYDGIEILPEIPPKAALASSVAVGEKAELPTIAIYHTHDDESYVPSDGTESIRGNGGIYDVGDTLKTELEQMGFPVLYSEARHDPHDVNAYNRSRETAASLLRQGGEVLIDVHRDAVPPENYATEVDGKEATKIKLVVGKSNPMQQSNMEFAKSIKAAMDAEKPGLSAGIYEGKGDYNQDLTSEAILIEVGAHTNSKTAAENGVIAFAQALPTALDVRTAQADGHPGATEQTGASETKAASGNRWKLLHGVWLLLLGCGAVYMGWVRCRK